MHIIYLDESGDPGRKGSPTGIYLIAGLSIDSAKWAECHQLLANFRKQVLFRHKLDPSCEMHANEFLGAAQSHLGLGRVDRLAIARAFIDVIALLPEARAFGWFVNKDMRDPLERVAHAASSDLDVWSSSGLLGRYTDGYLIIHDTFGHRPAIWRAEFAPPRISRPLDDDSAASLFLQAADFIAYALRQNLVPNSFMRAHGGRGLLRRLNRVSLGFRQITSQ